jgi:Fe-S cluster biogenesis protein NfuA/predicted RNase H-like HicB family nuclease
MKTPLKTHYYQYSNQEGDGYEVYFNDYPEIKGFGDTYEEAYEEASENLEAYLKKQKEKQMSEKQMMAEALAAYDAKAYKKAYEIWQGLAGSNADAMVNLGSLYAKGEGVAKDVGKALQWFEKALAKGHGVAAFYLGGMYENGIGVARDEAKAVECYEKAARLDGFTSAQVKLGLLLQNSDVKRAMGLLIEAAHQGDEQAQAIITYVSNAPSAAEVNLQFRSLEAKEQAAFVSQTVQERIAPALAADGGGVELVSFVPGETPQIWLRYLGACSGCHLGSTSTADMIITALEEAIDRRIVLYLW